MSRLAAWITSRASRAASSISADLAASLNVGDDSTRRSTSATESSTGLKINVCHPPLWPDPMNVWHASWSSSVPLSSNRLAAIVLLASSAANSVRGDVVAASSSGEAEMRRSHSSASRSDVSKSSIRQSPPSPHKPASLMLDSLSRQTPMSSNRLAALEL